ncbi:MAG: hypothetical protein AAFO03_21930 [Bacteroidota bacterium]
MAITLCSFGICTLEGLERIRVQVPEEQKEAYVHVWSAVGEMLGIVPGLLAGFFRKGERLEERSQPALQLLFDELSKVTMKAMFKYFDNYKQRTFVLHPELQRKWSLDAAE